MVAEKKVTANQALFNSTVRHQIHVLRYSEKQAQNVLEVLKAAEQELLEKITGAMAKGLNSDRLEAVLQSVYKRRAEVFASLAQGMEDELKAFSLLEADWEVGALKGSIPVEVDMASVPAETLHATVTKPIAGIPLKGWMENINSKEIIAIQAAVTQSVIQGETIDSLVRRIRGTKANNFADGILSVSTRNAQALARTSVNHVSNAARESVWNANSDIVRCLRWTATLDGRTSPICRSRDGHMAPVGGKTLYPSDPELIPAGARPPAHFNCRSLLVAVIDGVELVGDRPFVRDTRVRRDREKAFRAEAKERGVSVQQVRQEWADANVGRVPAATSYSEWLKTQPASFQDEILGHGKAEMFRAGVPLERFIDKSGRSLSLVELKIEIAGDALNVLEPAIGIKAKGLLMQGLSPQNVLTSIKNEFPDASTSLASIASYKSELNKAGLLFETGALTAAENSQVMNLPNLVKNFEAVIPKGVSHAVGGQWATVVEALDGHPGAYAHYKPGIGVQLSSQKMAGIKNAQASQIMAHELSHMLDKVHDVNLGPISASALKQSFDELPKDLKKLYSYYGTSKDELWAEILSQAIHDGPVTSQGIAAGPFKEHFKAYISQAKALVDETFQEAFHALPSGPVMSGIGQVAGVPKSIGGYAKALIQQGMPDNQVLTAIKAEFPNAKTTQNSINFYKNEMKKKELNAIGQSGPTISAQGSASIETPKPVAPVPIKMSGFADPAIMPDPPYNNVAPLSGLAKTGGKPGGSNPGGLYKDLKGDEWLIKGNLQKANGTQPKDLSDARAKNEVLASALIRTVDKALAPEMRLIDLEGEYGGGLGVMSKMLDPPVVKFNPQNSLHIAAAQEDFALHAWLGNYDVVGADFDNLVMKGGKAVNIDPGGALLFRAMGALKTDFDEFAETWDTMRLGTKNPNSKKVFGGMTDQQLKASASKLLVFTDSKIDEMVDAFGPGAPAMSDEKLKYILKKRRDAILNKTAITQPKVSPQPYAAVVKEVPVPAAPLPQPGLAALQGKYLQELDDLVLAQANAGGGNSLSDFYISKTLNKLMDNDLDDLISVDDIVEYKTWKQSIGAKVDMTTTSSADPTFLASQKAAEKAAKAQAKVYKQMSPTELNEALLSSDLKIASWDSHYKKQQILQQAAATLFKSGASTDIIKQALDIQLGAQWVPKATSLASLKSKLKKMGMLDGPVGGAESNLPTPNLWGINLGSKSTNVKEAAKTLIQQGQSADQVVTYIGGQFSSSNLQGAQDLYALAFYEVKTGKVQASKGASAVSKSYYTPKPAEHFEIPVPLRPATRIAENGPPPPRFDVAGRRAGLAKYGGLDDASASMMSKVNKMQLAAKLEELTAEELGAIRAYTGSYYRTINRRLRDGHYSSDVHLQAWSDAAMNGMAKLPKWQGEVIRGISLTSAELLQLKKFYPVGAVVEEVQFTSTANAAMGKGFTGGNVRYHIQAKSGRDVKHMSQHGGEQEILLMPGTKYKVTKTGAFKGDGLEIWMEEV
jgi:SPP1 gp7 family putative phage head morphogenesis protein